MAIRNCFSQVFDKWSESPYTWVKVAEALESVGEKWLVEDLHTKLSKKLTQDLAISTSTLVVQT